MSKKEESNRNYDSSHRQAQARQTRRAITEAARRQFTLHGYAGATLSAIAREAGVAVETIYATFGTKRALLGHLVDVSVVGDDDPVALLARPFVQATEAEPDPRQQIRMFAGQMRAIMGRMAPLFDVMRTAAKTEPDIAELRGHILAARRDGMLHFVRSLAAHAPLREGLSLEAAAEHVFALSSGELFAVLMDDLDWSGEAYEAWLAETLIATLLA